MRGSSPRMTTQLHWEMRQALVTTWLTRDLQALIQECLFEGASYRSAKAAQAWRPIGSLSPSLPVIPLPQDFAQSDDHRAITAEAGAPLPVTKPATAVAILAPPRTDGSRGLAKSSSLSQIRRRSPVANTSWRRASRRGGRGFHLECMCDSSSAGALSGARAIPTATAAPDRWPDVGVRSAARRRAA